MYTSLPNKFEKYFIIKPKKWHGNIIGIYHPSSIGCTHTELNQDDHSGPCLRDTFYEYVNPKEKSLTTRGNLEAGNIMHPIVERNAKKNDPFCFPEFPLQKLFKKGIMKIITHGSIDLPRQMRLTFLNEPEDPIYVNIGDIKTSSEYTFPKTEEDQNPTHFDQTYIYAAWLQNFYLNSNYIKIKDLTIIYINKHNLYTGEQTIPYDNMKGLSKFLDFIDRCWTLHEALLKYMFNRMELFNHYQNISEILPPKEPHKWCKLSENLQRCRDNVIFEENIKSYTDEEIEEIYKTETGKSPKWRGDYSKTFLNFKAKFKIRE